MQAYGLSLIDCQMYTDHLARLGAAPMPREDFIAAVSLRVSQPTPTSLWQYCFDNEPSRP